MIYSSSFKIIGILCIAICSFPSIEAVGPVSVPASSFNYETSDLTLGPLGWQGMCNKGFEQSPINIKTPDELEFAPYTIFFGNSPYCTEISHTFYVQNNGHSIQFEKVSNTKALDSNITISGGWLDGTYNFSQLHFHWGESNANGSEHAVDDKKYPMELHIVHHKNIYPDLNSAIASNDNQAVAVMAVFFTIGDRNNTDLDGIITVANQLKEPGPVMLFDITLQISSLYPAGFVQNMAVYNGSLTTPTCDERVIWSVFMETVEISEAQMYTMRGVHHEDDLKTWNARNLQPLNNRTVGF